MHRRYTAGQLPWSKPDLNVLFPQDPWTKKGILVHHEYEKAECCDFREDYCEMPEHCFRLMCKHTPTLDPPVVASPRRFNGFRVYDISASPRALFVPDFLPADDCDAMVQKSLPELTRSVTFVAQAKGIMKETYWRKSDGATISNWFPPLRRLHLKLSQLLKVPVDHFEEVSILRYKQGERYVPHTDFFDEQGLKMGEQRAYSLVVFLNEVEGGGHTIFPRAGWKVRPIKGSALLWKNYKGNDRSDGDYSTYHGGCYPEGDAPKWIATIWVHDGPVTWRAPPKTVDTHSESASADTPANSAPSDYSDKATDGLPSLNEG
jgi:prolyl 4-hydroxylase